jgi:hypothetical protein
LIFIEIIKLFSSSFIKILKDSSEVRIFEEEIFSDKVCEIKIKKDK